jgi:hypothetical protein
MTLLITLSKYLLLLISVSTSECRSVSASASTTEYLSLLIPVTTDDHLSLLTSIGITEYPMKHRKYLMLGDCLDSVRRRHPPQTSDINPLLLEQAGDLLILDLSMAVSDLAEVRQAPTFCANGDLLLREFPFGVLRNIITSPRKGDRAGLFRDLAYLSNRK